MAATTTDHYTTLGVRRSASAEEIKRAYRHQAKRYHPDRDPSPNAAMRFLRMQEAYETLRDPYLRIAYDAQQEARTQPHRDRAYRRENKPHQRAVPNEPEIRVRSWAFLGLHMTGLVFAIALITGLILGITYFHRPWGFAFFVIPGIIIIPDAVRGIRMWSTSARVR